MVFTTWKERSKRESTTVTKEFKCDINPSIILGRRGENIKRVQDATNTFITLERETNKIILVSYSEENINCAMDMINNLPEQNRNYNNRQNYDNQQNYNNRQKNYNNRQNYDNRQNYEKDVEMENKEFDLQNINFPTLSGCKPQTDDVKIENSIWGK